MSSICEHRFQAAPVSSLLVPPALQDFSDCFVKLLHRNPVTHCKALSRVENSCSTHTYIIYPSHYIHHYIYDTYISYIHVLHRYKKFSKIKVVSMVSNRNGIQTYKEAHQLPHYVTEPEATPKHQHNCPRRLPRSQLLLLENLPKPRIWVLLLLSKKNPPRERNKNIIIKISSLLWKTLYILCNTLYASWLVISFLAAIPVV